MWIVQSFALATNCGIGFLYKKVWFCNALSSIRHINYIAPMLFLLPWIFFIIYGYKLFRKYTLSKLEHSLILSLLMMYLGFFLYLVLSGYSG